MKKKREGFFSFCGIGRYTACRNRMVSTASNFVTEVPFLTSKISYGYNESQTNQMRTVKIVYKQLRTKINQSKNTFLHKSKMTQCELKTERCTIIILITGKD